MTVGRDCSLTRRRFRQPTIAGTVICSQWSAITETLSGTQRSWIRDSLRRFRRARATGIFVGAGSRTEQLYFAMWRFSIRKKGFLSRCRRLTVAYAAPTGGLDHAMRELAAIIGASSLAVLIPTMALAIWSIRKALTPLHDLASAAWNDLCGALEV